MSEDYAKSPAELDRSQHLATLNQGWATPLDIADGCDHRGRNGAGPGHSADCRGGAKRGLRRNPGAGSIRDREDFARGLCRADREAWVLGECASRGIPAPRVHALRRVEVGSEQRSIIVMEKLPGERLCDINLGDFDVRRVLGEVGNWLSKFHSIPVHGFGYLDGSGVGFRPTINDWLAGSLTSVSPVLEEAGRSVGLEVETVRGWEGEIADSFQGAPPRVALIHNDLLANHILVHDGKLSGIIDFGEVASEPATVDFARWDFNEGERFPIEWIQAGYRDPSLFEVPNDRTYRALWLATGLWLMQWYHQTGFHPGVEAARDRLLSGPKR